MQFHLNGYNPGDPEISSLAERSGPSGAEGELPEEVDVLIVGCGPAGLTLATQLAMFPNIKTCIVDQKPERLLRGQADGIACRTMEMFQAFGFADKVLREGYWANETVFWNPDEEQPEVIKRSQRVENISPEISQFPHIILNQARVHDFYLELMAKSPTSLRPFYSRQVVDVKVDLAMASDQAESAVRPVSVTLDRTNSVGAKETEIVKARYVVGCDGARSTVRKAIGRALHGDAANQAWGVMDVLAVTDFPDMRLRSVIQSASGGSIIIIPREGGYLVRVYIELDKLQPHERVSDRNLTLDQMIAAAQRVLSPYTFEVKDVAWWSVYEVGQRMCDQFDDVDPGDGSQTPCVFIAGDACHTHSPKGGQGMNVSMQDTFNLGWKLASVLEKRSTPEILRTYSAERQAVAKDLIDFDREWSTLLVSASKGLPGPDGRPLIPADVQRYFVSQAQQYVTGTMTRYRPSMLIGEPTWQDLASGFAIGTRFHSAPVVRLADAKRMHLGEILQADGRWRLIAFADAASSAGHGSAVDDFCTFLETSPSSPVRRYTPAGADVDAVIDIRAVFQMERRDIAVERMPPFLIPRKGRFSLRDYEKLFCPDFKSGVDIFEARNINREHGCIVVIRPDQYVAQVFPLHAHGELSSFFERFMISC